MAEGSINLLLNTKETSELFAPLPSARIKYACIATSSQHIALGANSGGVYCFSRDTLKYVQLLTNKEGAVSQVKFSFDGSWLAVVTGGGHVALWEFSAHKVPPWQRCHVSSLLKDATVKALQWDGKGARLFYGDDLGRVVAIPVPKLSIVFKLPDEIVYQAKESIVQIDVYQDTLLISTTQQCVLYKLVSKKVVQVGTKGRDGVFGACFDTRWKDRPPVIFSARPGGRVWEADIEGTVLSTLKLKEFVTFPSCPILGPGYVPDFAQMVKTPNQALNFCSLRIFRKLYMVGWQEGVLFVFNPSNYTLAVWTAELPSILDVCTDNEELAVLYCGGRKVGLLSVASLEECVRALEKERQMTQGVQLLCHYTDNLLKSLSSSSNNSGELVLSLQILLESVQDNLPPPLQPLRDMLPKREPPPVPQQCVTSPSSSSSLPLPGGSTIPIGATDAVKPAIEGSGDEAVGGATTPYDKLLDTGTPVEQLEPSAGDLGAGLGARRQSASPMAGTLPSERLLINQLEQRLNLELEATLPGMGSKEQATFGPEGQSEDLFVPSSPTHDIVEASAGRAGVGIAIQRPGKGTSVVGMETSKGSGPSNSLPMAMGNPLMQQDSKGTDVSEVKVVAASVPDRMAIAIQASVDEEDDIVAVPIRSGSSAVGIAKSKGQKKRKKGSRKNSDASDTSVTPTLSTPSVVTLAQPALSSVTNKGQEGPQTDLTSTSPSVLDAVPCAVTPVPVTSSPTAPPIVPVTSSPTAPPTVPVTSSPTAPPTVSITPSPTIPLSAPFTLQKDPADQSPSSRNLIKFPVEETDQAPPELTPALLTPPELTLAALTPPELTPALLKPPELTPIALQCGAGQTLSSAAVSSVPQPLPQGSKLENENISVPSTAAVDVSTNQTPADVPGSTSQLVPRPVEKHSQHGVHQGDQSDVGGAPAIKSVALKRKGSVGRLVSEVQLKKLKDFFAMYMSSGHALCLPATPILDPRQCQGSADEGFVKATSIAIDRLSDLKVISSRSDLRAVLSEWLRQLESFNIPPSPSKAPNTEDTGPIGERTAQSQAPPSSFERLSLNCRAAARWLLSVCLDLGMLSSRPDLPVSLEDFVVRYCSLLDVGRTKMTLERCDIATRCSVWGQLARYMLAAPDIDTQREKLLTPGNLPTTIEDIGKTQLSLLESLPACMLSILQLERTLFVPLCVATFPYTHPWEVVALLCGSKQATPPPSLPPPLSKVPLDEDSLEQLALYLDLLCSEGKEMLEVVKKKLRSDPDVAMVALEALLSVGPSIGQLKTEADSPLPCSHLVEWKYGHTLDTVCSLFTTMDRDHINCARQLSKECGYWKGYLQLTMAARDVSAYLEIALALKDMRLLTETQRDGPLLRTLGDWKLLLQCMVKADLVTTTTVTDLSQHEVTWTAVFKHILRVLGPTVLTKLLSEVDLSSQSDRLGSTFPLLHSTLVELIAIHTQQRFIAHHLLENVDHYLWSSRPAAMGPQTLFVHKHPEQLHSDQLSATSNDRVRTLEDRTHWGRRVPVQPGGPCVCCGVCRLPVLKPIVEHGAGVVTFPCGHVYHSQCLPELVCVLCYVHRISGPDGVRVNE